MSRKKKSIDFGTWKGKKISWWIWNEDGEKMFLVSQNALARKKFDESGHGNNEWKTSDIRKYLNEEYYKEAFSEEEKKRIFNHWMEDVGTKDNVYLLNEEEAEQIGKGKMNTGNGSIKGWWLRTKGRMTENKKKRGRFVYKDGTIGNRQTTYAEGVRPAIIIKK